MANKIQWLLGLCVACVVLGTKNTSGKSKNSVNLSYGCLVYVLLVLYLGRKTHLVRVKIQSTFPITSKNVVCK